MFTQQIVNGLVMGSAYALFALGLTLVFGIQRVLNLAHGAVFMWGALIGLMLVSEWGMPFLPALVLAGVAVGVLNVVVDFVAFRPLRRRGASEFGALVSSLGASLILVNLSQRATGAQTLRFPADSFPSNAFTVLGIRLSLVQVTVVAVAVVLLLVLLAYLYRTSLGRQVRAVAISERTSRLLGVSAEKVYLQTFFISGALAGITGVLLGISFNSVHSFMGDDLLLRAFVVIVLGGLGSVQGAVVAGLLMGLAQTFLVAYTSSELTDVAIFTALIAFLLFKPQGMFAGLHAETRVGRM